MPAGMGGNMMGAMGGVMNMNANMMGAMGNMNAGMGRGAHGHQQPSTA